MIPIKHLAIAVIGDEDLVSGLRLAGLSRCYIISEHNIRDELRETLGALLEDPDVSIIVILEDYVNYVDDLLAQAREGKKMTPVIIEVPSRRGTEYEVAREYYQALVRKFIGFALEM